MILLFSAFSAIFCGITAFLSINWINKNINTFEKDENESSETVIDKAVDKAIDEVIDKAADEKINKVNDKITSEAVESNLKPYKNIPIWSGISAIVGFTMGYYIFDKSSSWVSLFQIVIIAGLLIAAAFIDAKTRKIPNKIPLAVLAVGLIASLIKLILSFQNGEVAFFAKNWLLFNLLSSIVFALGLVLISKATQNGMGFGDVKLITSVCFAGGLRATVFSLFISLVICLIIACVEMILKKKTIKDGYPYAPFFFIGFLISTFIGLV